jgi:hypothetical protein
MHTRIAIIKHVPGGGLYRSLVTTFNFGYVGQYWIRNGDIRIGVSKRMSSVTRQITIAAKSNWYESTAVVEETETRSVQFLGMSYCFRKNQNGEKYQHFNADKEKHRSLYFVYIVHKVHFDSIKHFLKATNCILLIYYIK